MKNKRGRKLKGKEKRINQTVRVEPLVIEEIKTRFGGIQAFFDRAILATRMQVHDKKELL